MQKTKDPVVWEFTLVSWLTVFKSATGNQRLHQRYYFLFHHSEHLLIRPSPLASCGSHYTLPLGTSGFYHKQASCPVTHVGIGEAADLEWTFLELPLNSKSLGSGLPRDPLAALTLRWDAAMLSARWSPRLSSWGTVQVAAAPPSTSNLMTWLGSRPVSWRAAVVRAGPAGRTDRGKVFSLEFK